MTNSRYIQLDGCSNFREIGELKTTNGILRPGILFRSDELYNLSNNDLKIINSLGIKLICDLRTPKEIRSKPDRLPAETTTKTVNVPFFQQKRDYNQAQIMWLLITNSNKINFEKFIKEHYMNNAFERSKEVGSVIKLFCDVHNLPAVIHCKAGKDRTGFIAAIIQLLAGVNIENIYEEYLSTNIFMKKKMEAAEKIIRRMSLFRLSPERIKPLLEVRREYLQTVVDGIFKRFGSVENYLISACGLSCAEIEKVKLNICG